MFNDRKIRVLVVDDSKLFREILVKGLSGDPNIEIVATASDPFEARDKILETEPDVLTCDIEMPKMNGIEFVRRLMPQYPLPVIMVSTVSTAVFDAMSVGAVDFVLKPDVSYKKSVDAFIYELRAKIKVAVHTKVMHANSPHDENPSSIVKPSAIGSFGKMDPDIVIAIGASTGGTEALFSVIKALPSNMPGIVIVQHIPPVFSRMFADRLNTQTDLNVKEAQDGDYMEQGKVIIAPGDRHIKIKKIGSRYRIDCFEGEKVNGHCPSVDVLFDSVAKEAGSRAIGVILTGMCLHTKASTTQI